MSSSSYYWFLVAEAAEFAAYPDPVRLAAREDGSLRPGSRTSAEPTRPKQGNS